MDRAEQIAGTTGFIRGQRPDQRFELTGLGIEEEGVASLDGLAYLTTMRMSAQRARLVAGAMAQG